MRVDSYNSVDFDEQKIIPVIVSYDTHGNILPLYIRVGEIPYKVLDARLKGEGPYSQNVHLFQCRITDGAGVKHVVIKYHKKEDLWSILTPKSY